MFLQTSKLPWVSLRDAVVADDTALTTFQYSNWPTSNTLDDMKNHSAFKDANGLLITGFGTDSDNEDAAYKIYGRARMNGPIILIATGIVTCGAQLVTSHPITPAALTARWFDTITVTGGLFSGLIEILDSGNDRIAALKLDSMIFNDLFMEVDLDGGDTAMASFYAIICGY